MEHDLPYLLHMLPNLVAIADRAPLRETTYDELKRSSVLERWVFNGLIHFPFGSKNEQFFRAFSKSKQPKEVFGARFAQGLIGGGTAKCTNFRAASADYCKPGDLVADATIALPTRFYSARRENGQTILQVAAEDMPLPDAIVDELLATRRYTARLEILMGATYGKLDLTLDNRNPAANMHQLIEALRAATPARPPASPASLSEE